MALLSQQAIGTSPAFHALMDRVSDIASQNNAALLIGERGTGRGLMASRLHFLSPRWEQVYVSLNCAAYTEAELEAQLFGRVYYDSLLDIESVFIRASGGTLFLDHIEACPARLQNRLLDIIERGEIDGPAGEEPREFDVRLICAAPPEIAPPEIALSEITKAAKEGGFNPDLLGALAFHVLRLPPLRERSADIPPLAEHFGRKITASLGGQRFPGFTPEAMARLMAQSWPGNVRELKRAVERSVSQAFLEDESLALPIAQLADTPLMNVQMPDVQVGDVQESDVRAIVQNSAASISNSADFSERVMIFERGLIDEALSAGGGHQGRASEYLGLSYHQLRGLLRKHGLKK